MTEAAPTPVPELSGGRHYPCLDAYRGIAATMILVTHAGFATGYTQRGTFGDLVARLDIGVPLFFVLSGFLLYRPMVLSHLAEARPPRVRHFYKKRALRIFPAYWVALVAIVALFSFVTLDGARAWIANLLFLPAVGANEPYAISQAWSVGVEITFYALLPLYAVGVGHLARRSSRPDTQILLVGAAALYAAGMVFRLGVVLADPSWVGRSLLWLPMYIDLFAIGMAFAVASAGVAVRGLRVIEQAASHPALCWLAAGVVFVLIAQLEPPEQPFGLSGNEYLVRQFAYGLAAALWVLPAIFGDQSAGRLRHVLASRPLVWLGLISYSFYLWHLALIEQAKRWTVSGYDSLSGLAAFRGNVVEVTAIAFVLTACVAGLITVVIEQPILRLKYRPLRQGERSEERSP